MKISNRNRIKSRKMLHKHLHIIALFLYIFSYTHPVKAQDINSGLVGWWRLDETSGTSISDNSNTGNIGTWQTPPDVNSASGKIGRAIDFVDANGNYIFVNLFLLFIKIFHKCFDATIIMEFLTHIGPMVRQDDFYTRV